MAVSPVVTQVFRVVSMPFIPSEIISLSPLAPHFTLVITSSRRSCAVCWALGLGYPPVREDEAESCLRRLSLLGVTRGEVLEVPAVFWAI